MMQCFSVFEMHWIGVGSGGVILSIPILFWPAILTGIVTGLVSSRKWPHVALTLLILVLVLLAAFEFLVLITYVINPPHCLGDVLSGRELEPFKRPRLKDMLVPMMLGVAATFGMAFMAGAAAKWFFWRRHKSPTPGVNFPT